MKGETGEQKLVETDQVELDVQLWDTSLQRYKEETEDNDPSKGELICFFFSGVKNQ